MTRSTSALLVRNPIQYEFVPAKYPVEPSILNFRPDIDGIEDLETELVLLSGVGMDAARHARLKMTAWIIHISLTVRSSNSS